MAPKNSLGSLKKTEASASIVPGDAGSIGLLLGRHLHLRPHRDLTVGVHLEFALADGPEIVGEVFALARDQGIEDGVGFGTWDPWRESSSGCRGCRHPDRLRGARSELLAGDPAFPSSRCPGRGDFRIDSRVTSHWIRGRRSATDSSQRPSDVSLFGHSQDLGRGSPIDVGAVQGDRGRARLVGCQH